MKAIVLLLAVLAWPAQADCFRVGNRCALGLEEGEQAVAMMHAGWSAAVPLAGQYAGGRKGLWLAGGTWLAVTALQQFALNRAASNREARADVVTKFLPCTLILTVDLLRGLGRGG